MSNSPYEEGRLTVNETISRIKFVSIVIRLCVYVFSALLEKSTSPAHKGGMCSQEISIFHNALILKQTKIPQKNYIVKIHIFMFAKSQDFMFFRYSFMVKWVVILRLISQNVAFIQEI